MDRFKPRLPFPKGSQILKRNPQDIVKLAELYFIVEFKLRRLMCENN
jgi:hypothetical protein